MPQPQLLLASDWCSGTPLIRIPESQKLRHALGILGTNAAFAPGGFLSRMSFLDMYKSNYHKLWVIVDIFIAAQARLQSNKYTTEAHVLAVHSALCIF